MYLTDISHDFTFNIDGKHDEVLHALKFKKNKIKSSLPFLTSRVPLHSNQGRNTYLLRGKNIFSSVVNYTFVVEDIIKFDWKEGSKNIKYEYLKYADDILAHYWLSHTFLPLYYYLENIYDMLHMGAIEINGRACLFAAPSFGGKSTLTHFFLQKGHKLIADDRLPVYKKDSHYFAVPSYPYARNYRKIEDLGEYIENHLSKSLPIGNIYRLVQVEAEEKVTILEAKGVNKFAILEMSSDIKLSMLKKKEFANLNDLVANFCIYEISIPQNHSRLEEVYKIIVEHFHTNRL